MRRSVLAVLLTLRLGEFLGKAVSATASAPAKTAAVTLTGGHDTDPRDRGRPDVLVAAGLGVPRGRSQREAFFARKASGWLGSTPDPQQVQLNKQALMSALGKYGVTNDRLDEVSNMYRYPARDPNLWKHTDAVVKAKVESGKVIGFVIENAAGWRYEFTDSERHGLSKMQRAKVTLHFWGRISKTKWID